MGAKTKKTYREKLLDPRWQKKRLEIFDRDKWFCQACGNSADTLHVHHLKYTNGDPWDIDNKHLITLCEACHQQETEWRPQAEQILLDHLRETRLLYDDLQQLAVFLPEMIHKGFGFMPFALIGWALTNEDALNTLDKLFHEYVKKSKEATNG